jgi:hypothetical protein
MKSLYETLAVLGAGAVLLTGCGAAPAPVNAAEIPAASEAKPADAMAATATEGKTGDAAAAMVDGAKAPADMKAAMPAGATSAKPAAGAPVKKTGKKIDAKKTGAAGDCGEGTCGK